MEGRDFVASEAYVWTTELPAGRSVEFSKIQGVPERAMPASSVCSSLSNQCAVVACNADAVMGLTLI